ncbi:unnamed protein product [Rotaria sp. Silwood1]|nr:unnamed protein product [Rotaria sp. Silwood1]
MVTFNASDQAQIVKLLQELKSDDALTALKNLSEIIKIATGILPEKFIPVLQKLFTSYSTTTQMIKEGLADSCAILSKFVIKSWRIIQRGMNKADANALITLGNQLNTDFKNELAKFVDSSRPDLVNIYFQLLSSTTGYNIEDLLKEKDALEIDLLQRAEEITNKSSECGRIQGKIDSIEYEKQIYDIAIRDSEAAKSEMKEEIARLKAQIPEYKKEIEKYRHNYSEERQSFRIFSWKIQKTRKDNGQRIAREHLNRLHSRIRVLETKLTNWSNDDLTKKLEEATSILQKLEAEKKDLEKQHEILKSSHNHTEQKFHAVIEKINKIYETTGTVNVKSITAVDDLCRGLQTGSEALISACDKIRSHLEGIDLDPNSLIDAVLDALKLINMADEYNDSTKIKDIKRILMGSK